MNWVDLAVLGVLALSALAGLVRGLVREVLGIGAWVGASAVATALYSRTLPFFLANVPNADIARIAALGSVFLVALIVLSLVARAVSGRVRGSGLGGLDRTLGMVFGVARGAVLVVVAYICLGLASPADRWPEQVLQARVLDPTYRTAVWIVDRLPQAVPRPFVPRPPEGRQATAAALLQSTPQGRATGLRAAKN
jgi:membrane protein required for colicin V production